MKIAIVTLWTEQIKDFAQYTEAINKAYANKHGYGFAAFHNVIEPDRPPSWSKIPAIKYVMDSSAEIEYVMWIDADAAFANHKQKLEPFIDKDKEIMISDDLNCGVMILKNSKYNRELLRTIWKMEKFINHNHWENAAFRAIYNNKKNKLYKNCHLIPKKQINAFHPGDYTDGDFVAHMPAESLGARTVFFKGLANKLKEAK